MAEINNYLWSTIFQQNTDADRKIIDSVDLYLKDFIGAEGITWWSSGINGKAPTGLVEGIAEYTTLKTNYFPPAFAKPGSGDKWDQGYDFTARFLEYCDSLVPNFVAKLNKRIRKTFDVSFFKELTGKPVEQLWKDYKAKYAGKN
ncbi:zinc finger, CCHC-type containing protein [Tanacetum coccineum]